MVVQWPNRSQLALQPVVGPMGLTQRFELVVHCSAVHSAVMPFTGGGSSGSSGGRELTVVMQVGRSRQKGTRDEEVCVSEHQDEKREVIIPSSSLIDSTLSQIPHLHDPFTAFTSCSSGMPPCPILFPSFLLPVLEFSQL